MQHSITFLKYSIRPFALSAWCNYAMIHNNWASDERNRWYISNPCHLCVTYLRVFAWYVLNWFFLSVQYFLTRKCLFHLQTVHHSIDPCINIRSIFLSIHRLLVATQNGFLYVYDLSEVEGGDCKLIVKHNLSNVDTQPIKIQGIQNDSVKFFDNFGIFPLKWILHFWYKPDTQSNGSPLNESPSSGGNNIGPSYASAVKAGTSDEDQWNVSIFFFQINKRITKNYSLWNFIP